MNAAQNIIQLQQTKTFKMVQNREKKIEISCFCGYHKTSQKKRG